MKSKYTKKQIQESIKYWKNVLESINESNEIYSIPYAYALDRYDKDGRYMGEISKQQLDVELNTISKKYGVKARLTSMTNGPGGFPEIEITGTKEAIRKFHDEWYAGGHPEDSDETFDDYFEIWN